MTSSAIHVTIEGYEACVSFCDEICVVVNQGIDGGGGGGTPVYGPYFDTDAAITAGRNSGQSYSLTYPNGYDLPPGLVIKIP